VIAGEPFLPSRGMTPPLFPTLYLRQWISLAQGHCAFVSHVAGAAALSGAGTAQPS
jgi:hypothetical protein